MESLDRQKSARLTPSLSPSMTDEEFTRKLDEIGDTAGPAFSCLATIVITLLLFGALLSQCR